jgi:hypothetical protein
MNAHEVFQMLIYAGVGVLAFVFGRNIWSRPERMHDHWLRGSLGLPRRKWLLRTVAAIWVFIGFIAWGSALFCLPRIRQHSGDAAVLLVLLLSLVGTVVVLGFTPRRDTDR